jgi:serine/threonine-protein kinase
LPPESGQPARLPDVPGYELVRVLGRGGMGVVYLARHLGLGRDVALKFMLAAEHAGPEDRRRFHNEARAVARLTHPHIVRIHDVSERDGVPYCCLEFCPGGLLADRLVSGPLPVREAAELVRSLALAVQAAHDQQIVHRDLKPANILFAADGTPRVADFGLARRMDGSVHTQPGAILGTPSYMAPEQARGSAGEVGPHTDVYALGAILYECLTGRPPFLANNPVDTLLCAVTDPPAPPRQLRKEVPPRLEAICLRCLEKLPDRRPASARELADELEAFLQGRRRLAPGRAHRGQWLWQKRNAALAVLALAVALFVTVLALQGKRPAAPGTADGDRALLSGEAEPKKGRRKAIRRDDVEADRAPPPGKAEPRKGGLKATRRDDLVNDEQTTLEDERPGDPKQFVGPQFPNLHAVVAGINDYGKARVMGEQVRALYSASGDAKAVAEAFKKQEGKYYRKVHMSLLIDEAVTRDALLAQLYAVVEPARSTDVFLLYLSGQGGVRHQAGPRRRLGPKWEFVTADTNEKRGKTSISSTDIAGVLRELPCHCIILLDAGNSGAFIEEPGLDPKRHVVLTACGADEASLEINPRVVRSLPSLVDLTKHSLFTRGLLDGLQNRGKGKNIDSRDLFDHIRTKVDEPLLRLRRFDPTINQTPVIFPANAKPIPFAVAIQ